MKNLAKFVRRLSDKGARPQVAPDGDAIMADDAVDDSKKLTLEDRELIGFIEAMDKRLYSLEHDLWVIRSRITEWTGGEQPAP